MISSFKIRNFKSILDLEVDFKFNEGKAPNGYRQFDHVIFLQPNKTERYIPCLAIYGANAAGKSNIIQAFEILQKVVEEGIDKNYVPNKLNAMYNSTLFELVFFVNKHKYLYRINYNSQQIIEECLQEDDKLVYQISLNEKNFKNITKDAYDEKKLENIFFVECCNINKNQTKSFLQKLASNYAGLNGAVVTAFGEIIDNIDVYEFNGLTISRALSELALLDASSVDAAFNKIVTLLRRLDIDIDRMYLERKITTIEEINKKDYNFSEETEIFDSIDVRDGKILRDYIYTFHKNLEGQEVGFRFADESNGTKMLAGILGIFLVVLERGGTLIVDELENSLHPLLFIELVRMFKDKRYNKRNAQLVFTAHNTDILDVDVLRISEVAIVRKNIKEGTSLRSLSSFEGIRNVTNFRKQYLSGAFSGIPHSYI